MEVEVTNTFHAPLFPADELIWGWEVPMYLFLGGLVAGMMILSGAYYLSGRRKGLPFTVMGGIKLDNLDQVLGAGTSRVAVVTAITQQQDIAAAVREFRTRILAHRTEN